MALDVERRDGGTHPDVAERVHKTAVRRDLATLIHAPRLRGDGGGLLVLTPGRAVGLHGMPGSGLTRLGLAMLVEASLQAPVVAVDVRGWISPLAAWEVGIRPGRFVVVRPDLTTWAQVVGSLMDGIGAVYAEIPRGIPDSVLRRVVAVARRQRVGLILRPLHGYLPSGLVHLSLEAEAIEWEGAGQGHGHLRRRSLRVTVSGKGASGIERMIEVEDDGTNPVRVVGRMAAAAVRRTAG